LFGNPILRKESKKDIIIVTINDRKITHESLDKEIEKQLNMKFDNAIFISRHTSKSGRPTLTTHPIGNYGKAEFGGRPKTLVKSSPKLMTQLLRILKRNAKSEQLYHKVCFEVTHHGPYLETPTLFIEVGSNEEEWNKKKPAKIVAKSVVETLENLNEKDPFFNEAPVIIGIGGGHYAPRFTDVALEKYVAFGHMIPLYHIKEGVIDTNMIEETLKKTPDVSGVYIHKKSLKKSQVTEYKNWFQKKDIKVFSSKELKNL
jgi:D-aminoacyl-tRNA deacylase